MRLKAWAKDSANLVLNALFEPPCAACRTTLTSPLDGSVCDACWASIRASASLDEHFDHTHAITWVSAVHTYDGRMKDIIHALKYDRRRSISPRLGAMMRERGAAVLQGADCVVPVPLHPLRAYTRGFNQAHDIAVHLGPPVRPLLQRVVHTPSQIDLPREQRLANVENAFAIAHGSLPSTGLGAALSLSPLDVARDAPEPVEGSKGRLPVPGIAVLVDDVSTTGATLDACARVLRAAGVTEVRALTAARVVNTRR